MSVFGYEKDSEGIVTVTMDMTGPVNAMNDEYDEAMEETIGRLESEAGLVGVVFASAKKVFFAGGDLNSLVKRQPGEEQAVFDNAEGVKRQLRRLEKLPVPVVAAINGAALGGGFELCLACNYRIAYNHPSAQLGLPEVSLGLLPGAGGVVRMVHTLGLEAALPYLLEGSRITPAEALSAGLIHELADSVDALLPRAKAFILANKDKDEAAVQPWDRKGFSIPGGDANAPAVAQAITMTPTVVRRQTRGLLPAPEEIMDCAVSVLRVDFDTALRIESRSLTHLVMTPQAKNMINASFFQMNQVKAGKSRPKNIEKGTVTTLGVMGAAAMGQHIACTAAKAGIKVILKGSNRKEAEAGKACIEKLLSERVTAHAMEEARKQAILDLIVATEDDANFHACELLIDSVVGQSGSTDESIAVNEKHMPESAVLAVNTSSLDITHLAEESSRPEQLIGVHFCSQLDELPLVELIPGSKTSEQTLARAFDFARQIKRTPIVVNDFFVSRVFGTYLDEGIRILHEGLDPVRLENLGKAVGMRTGPLQAADEAAQLSTDGTVNARINQNSKASLPDQDVKDRLLFRPVIESLQCLESKILRSVAEGNVGSLLGIAAPTWTGGYIQFVNTYGLEDFIERCDELSIKYGERFKAPTIVREKLAAGELFT